MQKIKAKLEFLRVQDKQRQMGDAEECVSGLWYFS